ncbi:MAG: GAF domain-containing sensor histidine kinase [Deltaproteobacteria bacterium]|nr:GAF domain-containing sensor histidine kinase [Kofleriaceae bacterium]
MLDDRVLGALALLFGDERPFDRDERGYLTLLALHCAQGLERAHLYGSETRARRAAEAAQGRAAFLSRASAVLGSSLDYEETLGNVARLAVPSIADWCVIDLVGDDGHPRQVAVAHVDPAKVEFAREVLRRYPPVPDDRTGVTSVLRTGAPELYPEITDAMLVASAHAGDHLRLLREVGLRSVILVPIKDRGRVLGVLTFVLTALDRHYDRDDLRMAEQLGERAGAAIANATLYAEARAAIRAREEFLLVAGHELRTPLAALSLHVDALLDLRDDASIPSVRQRAHKLRAQTDRIARLVEDLLDVSKLTAGRLELEREEVELGGLVREVLGRMREEAERARSPVVLAIDPVHGHWDRSRIDQIVANLFANALRYGKGHPVQVVVRRRGDHAVLVVSDLGIGIAAEDQARVFERFERAVSTRHFGGLGLGLSIVRELVAAHHGTIALQSAPGRGATFAVSLPLAT